jgi:transcriptional regulator with XRE-family HTH domain
MTGQPVVGRAQESGNFGYFMVELCLIMNEKEAREFGAMLRERRESLGLTTRQAAKQAQILHTTLVRIEQGQTAAPRPDKLARLATVLGFTPGELFASVGYVHSTDLPDIRIYLKAKYPDLPEATIDRLGEQVDQLTKKQPTLTEGVNDAEPNGHQP